MKSHDIGLLLKLAIIRKYHMHGNEFGGRESENWPPDWRDWNEWSDGQLFPVERGIGADQINRGILTTRQLEKLTGISKTQVALSLTRCIRIGLARADMSGRVPIVNTRALLDFIAYGLRYVFPVSPGELTRGIGTSWSAPVLAGKLMSAGELALVWPHATGTRKGLSVEPLYNGAVFAAVHDPHMYSCLALVDAIRMGRSRERNLALQLLKEEIE